MGIFGAEGQKAVAGGTETVIGSSVKVDGKFIGRGNIVIEGKVVGSMKTDQDLHIQGSATVHADIEARNIFVAGEVRGNIKAQDRLELAESAKVTGDVLAKVVTINAGATLNGKCTMTAETIPIAAPSNDDAHDREKNRQQKSHKAIEAY